MTAPEGQRDERAAWSRRLAARDVMSDPGGHCRRGFRYGYEDGLAASRAQHPSVTAPESVVLTDGEPVRWATLSTPDAVQALREAARSLPMRRDGQPWQGAAEWLVRRADALATYPQPPDHLAADRAAHDCRPWRDCTGAGDCPGPWHVHGCYADDGQCDDPKDHADIRADRAAHEALRADIDSQVQGMEALLSALTYADGVPEDPMLQSAYLSGFAAAAKSVARHLRAALAAAAPTSPQDGEVGR